jgi:hypothetical protein
MSNEISLGFKLSVTKSSITIVNATQTKTQNQQTTLAILHHTTQIVGTSAEALSTGDVSLAAEHWVLLVNRDSTNYVDVIGYKDGANYVIVGRMRPGEPWMGRLTPQTAGYPCIKLQANTANCNVEVVVAEAGDPAA